MPTYTVTVANLALSPKQKSQIAEAITTAHNAQTGAPRFFAQVLFSSTHEGVWIYLQDIPETQMIEFGRFLPAPGEEAEWERQTGNISNE
jgi:phenylpyruvate tautomerase PptA (4-oxalocrotonate tautomerase family)